VPFVYDLLLRRAAETVLEVAANPDHLGARTGVLAVLHTWGQALQFHPHVHCVVPGGGLSFDRTCWVGSRPDFFLPVRVLGRVFRGKFLAGLRAASTDGRLRLSGRRGDEVAPGEFERLVSAAIRTDWVVYAKPPFGGPEVVLKYLARYTHRVAIGDSRLLDFEDGIVRFRYKDYAHGDRKRVMKLSAREFVRRLLLHVLPAGFVRIRHYGILSNRHRQEDLALCRELLGDGRAAESGAEETVEVAEAADSITPTRACPNCGAGRMVVIAEFPPPASGAEVAAGFEEWVVVDSS
jgi:hypothetical protein